MSTRISDDGSFDDAGGEAGRPDRELMQRAIRTLAIAIHRRFKLLSSTGGDTMTAQQWQTLIQDEWKNRRQSGD